MLLWVRLRLCLVFGIQEYAFLTDYLLVIALENAELVHTARNMVD